MYIRLIMFFVAGITHQTSRSVMLEFQAGVIRHKMTTDDEGFGTLTDVIATVGGDGLLAAGSFNL